MHDISTATALHVVGTGAAIDLVATVGGCQRVVARPAVDVVVAAETADRIVPGQGSDCVVPTLIVQGNAVGQDLVAAVRADDVIVPLSLYDAHLAAPLPESRVCGSSPCSAARRNDLDQATDTRSVQAACRPSIDVGETKVLQRYRPVDRRPSAHADG